MAEQDFKPAYNAVAALIMFNRALDAGDMEGAREIAQICIDAQRVADDR